MGSPDSGPVSLLASSNPQTTPTLSEEAQMGCSVWFPRQPLITERRRPWEVHSPEVGQHQDGPGANLGSLLPLFPQAFASSVGWASTEQGRLARQWAACITRTASPVTPVVGDLFLSPPVPRAPWRLTPLHVDRPALAPVRCGGG